MSFAALANNADLSSSSLWVKAEMQAINSWLSLMQELKKKKSRKVLHVGEGSRVQGTRTLGLWTWLEAAFDS